MLQRRVLVTGASGFVGRRLVQRLLAEAQAAGSELELGTLSRRPLDLALARGPIRHRHWCIDLTQQSALPLARALEELRPDEVYHLAGLADPQACADDPRRAHEVNVLGTDLLLRQLLAARDGRARVLLCSTAQVYGSQAPCPIHEQQAPRPSSVYASTKLQAEELGLDAAQRGLEVVIARPFNHSAPEQSTRYVLPALAAELRAAAAAGRPARTGNLYPKRDFLHVEDVLSAYRILLERGQSGLAYNVCSGRPVSIGELFEGLRRRIAPTIAHEFDPARQRGAEAAQLYGSPARLAALGWAAVWDLEALLDDFAR